MERSHYNQLSKSLNNERCRYRNLKHEKFNKMMFLNILLYYNNYLQPILNRLLKLLLYLREVFGFILIILSIPGIFIVGLVTQITRSIQLFLFKKYASKYTILCSNAPFRKNNDVIISSVILLNGSVDVKKIQSFIEKLHCLKMNLIEKYSVLGWVTNEDGVTSKVLFMQREMMRKAKNRSGFYGVKPENQQLISYILKNFEPNRLTASSWRIVFIPEQTGEKAKTFCILQFHSRFLSSFDLQCFLQPLFGEKFPITNSSHIQSSLEQNKSEGINFIQLYLLFEKCRKTVKTVLCKYIKQTAENYGDIKASLNLKVKQYHFHTKTVFFQLILNSLIWNCLSILKTTELTIKKQKPVVWGYIQSTSFTMLFFLRAISYIPFIFIKIHILKSNSLVRKSRRNTLRTYNEASWSQSVSTDIFQAILSKESEASISSIILAACSMGFQDYFLDWNIPNRGKVEAVIQNVSSDRKKLVRISTKEFEISNEIKKTETNINDYPPWKENSFRYLHQAAEYLFPLWISRKMNIDLAAPMIFKYMDLDSPNTPSTFPSLSLWEYPVENVWTFAEPMETELSGRIIVTAIKYCGNIKLSIFSGVESLDIALAKMFPRYLNKIAEALGVEKTLIPYSQKSSPIASSCDTPINLIPSNINLNN